MAEFFCTMEELRNFIHSDVWKELQRQLAGWQKEITRSFPGDQRTDETMQKVGALVNIEKTLELPACLLEDMEIYYKNLEKEETD